MSIPLSCPSCDLAFAVSDELAGKPVNCPSCRCPVVALGAAADDDAGETSAASTRGSWVVAAGAGVLAAAALLFALLSYSRARSLADSLAAAELRADSAVAAGEELKARLAAVERREHEAAVGREDFKTRLAETERKAEAAVAARDDLNQKLGAPPALPAPRTDSKGQPPRRRGTVTLPNGEKRSFVTLSGGRYASGLAPGGGQADSIQRAAGEIVLYPAGERLREILIPVASIQSLAIGARAEKDAAADDAERLFSVQVAGPDGKSQSWKVEAPLTIYVHWADGLVIEQLLNRDLLGMTFSFETETPKGR